MDFSQFDDVGLINWEDYFSDDLTYVEGIQSILSDTLYLPDSDRQKVLATIYLLIPSALAKKIPILICHGLPGSGKSTFGIIASKLRNSPVHTGADTFASIRNSLNQQKWIYQEGKRIEKNAILIWDDIDPDILLNKVDIYRLLKSGYDKGSDTISIADKGGKNIKFRTFTSKILSTIHPVYSLPDFSELTRRCIVLRCKKIPYGTGLDLTDLHSINWDGIDELYDKFWNYDRCYSYAKNRVLVSKRPHSEISTEQWAITVDLICTGFVAGIFETISDGVEFFKDYWNWFGQMIKTEQDVLQELLAEFVTQEAERFNELKEKGINRERLIISPRLLKGQIDLWESQSRLLDRATPRAIRLSMQKIGFKLTTEGWVNHG